MLIIDRITNTSRSLIVNYNMIIKNNKDEMGGDRGTIIKHECSLSQGY
jgi:hypothetical protein